MAWLLRDLPGNYVNHLYDLQGNEIFKAYDINGNEYVNGELKTYNFMTYNVQNWTDYNSNTPVIEAMFRRHNPIIVGLQECNSASTYVPALFAASYKSTGIGNPIMLFTNVEISDYETILYADNQGERRGYQKFKVTLDGKEITVFNTHVELETNPSHIPQLQELLVEFAKCDSFVAMGDFNIVSASNSHWQEERDYFVEPLIEAGYNSVNWTPIPDGDKNTWFNGQTIETSRGAPCDSIIMSPDLKILDVVLDTSKVVSGAGTYVDHIPVIVTIGFYVEGETTT